MVTPPSSTEEVDLSAWDNKSIEEILGELPELSPEEQDKVLSGVMLKEQKASNNTRAKRQAGLARAYELRALPLEKRPDKKPRAPRARARPSVLVEKRQYIDLYHSTLKAIEIIRFKSGVNISVACSARLGIILLATMLGNIPNKQLLPLLGPEAYRLLRDPTARRKLREKINSNLSKIMGEEVEDTGEFEEPNDEE